MSLDRRVIDCAVTRLDMPVTVMALELYVEINASCSLTVNPAAKYRPVTGDQLQKEEDGYTACICHGIVHYINVAEG